MTFSTYNPDKRYEMMAAILPDPDTENLPEAGETIKDLQHVIELCYIYTTEAGTARELDASDLAEAIIDYLFTEWAWKAPDMEKAARAYWNYPTLGQDCSPGVSAPPEPTGDPSDGVGIADIEGTSD